MVEQWRDVPGYEGYYMVSNTGKVRSLERWCRNTKSSYILKPERILKPRLDKRGYHRVALCIDGFNKDFFIHQLVARAFIPNPNNLPVIHHKDNTTNNNMVDNLMWVTGVENTKIGWRLGRMKSPNCKGSSQGNSILVEGDVVEIRRLKAQGVEAKTLAEQFNVSESTIYKVNRGSSWKHIL